MSRSHPDDTHTPSGWLQTIHIAILASLSCLGLARADYVWLPNAGGISTSVPGQSIASRRFSTVVRQQYDFSCGSAALATLLTYHYDERTDERAAFRSMYDKGDKAKIVKSGFSLLDIKRYLEERGYQADGYEASLDKLEQAGVPAIALISYRGYRHFVVLKGMNAREVLIGDPALGLRSVQREEFDGMWTNHILFIIKNKSAVGQQHFNPSGEWATVARAPMGNALGRDSLASITIALPLSGDF
jgi:predicted double-glycine peptidase